MPDTNPENAELKKNSDADKKTGIKDYLKSTRRKGLSSRGQQSLINFEMPEKPEKESPDSKAQSED